MWAASTRERLSDSCPSMTGADWAALRPGKSATVLACTRCDNKELELRMSIAIWSATTNTQRTSRVIGFAMFDKRCLRSKNKETQNCMLAILFFEYKPPNQCYAPDTERPPAHVESEPGPSTRVTDASAQDVDGVMWNRMWAAYEAACVKHDLIASAAPDTPPHAHIAATLLWWRPGVWEDKHDEIKDDPCGGSTEESENEKESEILQTPRSNWSANPRTT